MSIVLAKGEDSPAEPSGGELDPSAASTKATYSALPPPAPALEKVVYLSTRVISTKGLFSARRPGRTPFCDVGSGAGSRERVG